MVIALLLHVALVIPSTPAVPSGTFRTAVAEAAALWAPYGVVIELAAPGGTSDDRIVLTIVPIETRRFTMAGGWSGALGAISFDADGVPGPRIRLFVTDILALVGGARMFSQPEWQWPRSLHDQIVGRVIGRVLAHEIGHFLLRMPRHTAAGLMRPVQFQADLVAMSRQPFTLTAVDVSRLATR